VVYQHNDAAVPCVTARLKRPAAVTNLAVCHKSPNPFVCTDKCVHWQVHQCLEGQRMTNGMIKTESLQWLSHLTLLGVGHSASRRLRSAGASPAFDSVLRGQLTVTSAGTPHTVWDQGHCLLVALSSVDVAVCYQPQAALSHMLGPGGCMWSAWLTVCLCGPCRTTVFFMQH